MRYLKKFNESVSEDILEEFTTTTNNYLAYLLDDGAEVKVTDKTRYYPFSETINLHISIEMYNYQDSTIKWDDIKDYIIPYIEYISNEYSFTELEDNCEIMIRYYRKWTSESGGYMTNYVRAKDIINDNLPFLDGAYHKNNDDDIQDYIAIIV